MTYHAIIRTALTTEELGLLAVAFIDDTIGEHRLLRDTEDEGTEASVFVWLTLSPHFSNQSADRPTSHPSGRLTIHDLIDFTQS